MSPLSLQGCRFLHDTQARNLRSPTNRTIDDEIVADSFQFFFPISIALAPLNVSQATARQSIKARESRGDRNEKGKVR